VSLITVYALCEPDTDEIRYIGQTADLKGRMVTHLCPSPAQNGGRFDWIRELKSKGLAPTVRVLEEVEPEQALTREAYWISHYQEQGAPLFNGRPGREKGKYKQFPHQHAVRFTEEGWRKLQVLAERWNCSEAEAVRRLVDKGAAEEGVE
jgi:hypothetical protein